MTQHVAGTLLKVKRNVLAGAWPALSHRDRTRPAWIMPNSGDVLVVVGDAQDDEGIPWTLVIMRGMIRWVKTEKLSCI